MWPDMVGSPENHCSDYCSFYSGLLARPDMVGPLEKPQNSFFFLLAGPEPLRFPDMVQNSGMVNISVGCAARPEKVGAENVKFR